MSQTRAVVRGRIQELLGDVDPTQPIFNTFRYNECIHRNINLIAGRTIQVDSTAASVTLIAGTYDYTVTAALGELQSVSGVFLSTEAQELIALPWHEFNSIYLQDTSQPVARGVPRHYTFWESTSSPRIRVGPTPATGGTLVLHEKTTVDLPTADGSSISFSEQLIRALECDSAADLLELAAPETVQRLGKAPAFAQTLRAQSQAMIKSHNQRKLDLGRRQPSVFRRGNQWPLAWGR